MHQTTGEIAIISVLMAAQIAIVLAIAPFYYIAQLFIAPKVEAAW